MVHIKKGCLSDISPGTGTNRNEILHKHINTYFCNMSRIGLPFALALLMIILFQHNCNIEERLTGKYTLNLSSWMSLHLLISTQKFGVNPKDIRNVSRISSSTLADVPSLDPAFLQQWFHNVQVSQEVLELISLGDTFNLVESAINCCKIATAMQKQTAKSPAYNIITGSFQSCLLWLQFFLLINAKDTNLAQ